MTMTITITIIMNITITIPITIAYCYTLLRELESWSGMLRRLDGEAVRLANIICSISITLIGISSSSINVIGINSVSIISSMTIICNVIIIISSSSSMSIEATRLKGGLSCSRGRARRDALA